MIFTAWGLPDDLLFKQAKLKLAKLMSQHQPFNLTILTVDTHGLTGQLTQACRAQGFHDFTGIVECSANHVADFIHYIKAQGWLEQMTIVIVGDHLAMQNAISQKLALSDKRTIYNLFISQEKLYKRTDDMVHFDLLPTILELLGFRYPGHQLGLGHSLIAEQPVQSKPITLATLARNIDLYSKAYQDLWLRH